MCSVQEEFVQNSNSLDLWPSVLKAISGEKLSREEESNTCRELRRLARSAGRRFEGYETTEGVSESPTEFQ